MIRRLPEPHQPTALCRAFRTKADERARDGLSGAGRRAASTTARSRRDDCHYGKAGDDRPSGTKPAFHANGLACAYHPQGAFGLVKPGAFDPGTVAHTD